MWRNLRFGLRYHAGNKSFTLLAILVVALGIGPNTAIFSVVYATFLEPPDWGHAEQVMALWTMMPNGGKALASIPDYLDWKREAASFSDIEGALRTSFNVTEGDEPELFEGMKETPGMWRFLGQKMLLGRDFVPSDATPGKDRVALLAHKLWVTRFGADPHIIGKTVHMNGIPYTVIGIRGGGQADRDWNQISIPLTITPDMENQRQSRELVVLGRLKPDRTIRQAQGNMQGIMNRLAREFPDSNRGLGIKVEPFWNDFLPEKTRKSLYLLMGSVSFVLLIACVNVASLLLSRGSARQKELAVRVSLGASKWQVFSQLVTEAVMLAVAGGVLGVGLAWMILKAVMNLMPEGMLPIEAEVRLSIPVLLFTAVCTVLSGIIFGCVPAWTAIKRDLNQSLNQVSRSFTGGKRWVQRSLVVVEFALALTLLSSAGLAIHSFWKLTRIDWGINADNVLSFQLPLDDKRFSNGPQAVAFYRNLLAKINAVPGVRSASIGLGTPLNGGGTIPFGIAGEPPRERKQQPRTGLQLITPSYMETYGIRLMRGRGFTDEDRLGTLRVALVNENFARRFFPGADPVGKRIETEDIGIGLPDPAPTVQWEIVGVYHNVQSLWNLDQQNSPEIYLPFWQAAIPWNVFGVRTAADRLAMRKAISAAVHSVEPTLPLAKVRTVEQIRNEGLANDRFTAALYASFAALALLLALAGIYGVMTHAVSERTHEIGVRAALGADASALLRLILGEGMLLATAGLAAGLAGAFVASRLLRSTLFGIGRIDFGALAVVAGLLLGSALIACYMPARRATRVDPMTALRDQ